MKDEAKKPKALPDRLVVEKLQILNREELCVLLGINRKALRRWLAKFDDFPRPVWISNRVARWRRHDIDVWFDSRPKQAKSPEWLEGRRNAR
jgi:predicted DNA-binding transcriptional regulator AlpA